MGRAGTGTTSVKGAKATVFSVQTLECLGLYGTLLAPGRVPIAMEKERLRYRPGNGAENARVPAGKR